MRFGRGCDQVILRLPEGMREEIKKTANENLRSMNSEIVFRLQNIYTAETKKGEATA